MRRPGAVTGQSRRRRERCPGPAPRVVICLPVADPDERTLLLAAVGGMLRDLLADGAVVPPRRVRQLADVAAQVWRGEPVIDVPAQLVEPLRVRTAGLMGWTV